MSTEAFTKLSLTIKRRLRAPPAKVYRAWTHPQKMIRWWAPEQAETLRAEADARVGGRYRIVMRTADGEEHSVSGVYREVIPNEKLVFTWAWRSMPERESLVTVLIKSDGDGSFLTLSHEQFFDEAARDAHRSGWTGVLDKLEKYLVDDNRSRTWNRTKSSPKRSGSQRARHI
jgi:uncharacterized protein YndB with AHSA1/START domain